MKSISIEKCSQQNSSFELFGRRLEERPFNLVLCTWNVLALVVPSFSCLFIYRPEALHMAVSPVLFTRQKWALKGSSFLPLSPAPLALPAFIDWLSHEDRFPAFFFFFFFAYSPYALSSTVHLLLAFALFLLTVIVWLVCFCHSEKVIKEWEYFTSLFRPTHVCRGRRIKSCWLGQLLGWHCIPLSLLLKVPAAAPLDSPSILGLENVFTLSLTLCQKIWILNMMIVTKSFRDLKSVIWWYWCWIVLCQLGPLW